MKRFPKMNRSSVSKKKIGREVLIIQKDENMNVDSQQCHIFIQCKASLGWKAQFWSLMQQFRAKCEYSEPIVISTETNSPFWAIWVCKNGIHGRISVFVVILLFNHFKWKLWVFLAQGNCIECLVLLNFHSLSYLQRW